MADAINWLGGSLMPYESIWSIGAKFCYWNCVPPVEFYRYLAGFTLAAAQTPGATASFGSPPMQNTTGDGEGELAHPDQAAKVATINDITLDLPRLARTMREPVAMLRASLFSPMQPARYGHANTLAAQGDQHSKLRLCRHCAAHGYHGVFHQLPWFSKCIIHGTDLTAIALADQRANRLSRRPNEHGALMIAALLKLNESEEFRIGAATALDAPTPWNRISFHPVDHYVNWLGRMNKYCRSAHTQDLGQASYDYAGRVSAFLQFLHRQERAPEHAAQAWQPSRVHTALSTTIHVFEPSQREVIAALFEGKADFLWLALIELRLMQCRLSGEHPIWHTVAKDHLQHMLHGHEACGATQRQVLTEKLEFSGAFRIRQHHQACGRMALAQQYQRHWNCMPGVEEGEAEDFEAEQLMKLHAAQHMASLATLNGTGLIQGATCQVALLGFLRHLRETEVTCWEPIPVVREMCDAVLAALAEAHAWMLHDMEGQGKEPVTIQTLWNNPFNPIFSVKAGKQMTLELTIGRRTPVDVPVWRENNGHIPDPLHRVA